MIHKPIFFFLTMFLFIGNCVTGEPQYKEQLIFDPVQESHGHVHASCIVECPNGDLLAVWYENGPVRDDYFYKGPNRDKSDDVRIGGARRLNGADAWSTPFVMSDTYGVSDNNPCMVIDREERLWLFHPTLTCVPDHAWGSSILNFKISSDYQKSGPPRWDRESILIIRPNGLDEEIQKRIETLRQRAAGDERALERIQSRLDRLSDPFARRFGWMPRAHPLILSNGTLLLPVSNENFSYPAMVMTSDGGETWITSRVVPGGGATQPTVVELPDKSLIAFFRSGEKRIKRSESHDGGMTWSEITLTDLPHPGAGIEALLLRNGHLLMIYNDKEDDPRDSLAVSISEDQGKTWKWTRHVAKVPNERFDYPSIIQAKDGTLHATWSYNTKAIQYAHFNEEWIQAGE
ncbi:MAG TPA: exo-alpha-sialidase [bacterium]|nr:exo-alpha-sialidase [bacterium]